MYFVFLTTAIGQSSRNTYIDTNPIMIALLQFERPANQSAENCARRAAIAQEFYDKFAGGISMNLLKCLLTENDCYKASCSIKPKGVMVHSTGANNSHASAVCAACCLYHRAGRFVGPAGRQS